MAQTYPKTFRLVITLLFLLPLFFIPGGLLNLNSAKALLLSIGTVLLSLVFLWEFRKAGTVDVPWHRVMFSVVLLPAVYFLSAILSTPAALSIFGYNFEAGTFGFMLLVSILLIITSIVVNDARRVLSAITSVVGALALVMIFAAIKISTGFPVWGVFTGNTGNPAGDWTDLSALSGLLSIVIALGIGMIPMTKLFRIISYFIFGVSLLIVILLNFSLVFTFTFAASLLLIAYFLKIEKSKRIVLPIILGAVSLVFIINPNLGALGNLGDLVTRTFGTGNADVRPSLGVTLSVSKAALSRDAFLGSGPNTFSRDWLMYKPADVNTTPFWRANFSYGSGFIPTQIASTGIAGTVLWIILLASLLWMGLSAIMNLPKSRGERFSLVASFLSVLYLWTAAFLYAPSFVVLTLTFIFTGLFISAARGLVPYRVLTLSGNRTKRFAANSVLALSVLGLLLIGYKSVNSNIAASYFQKALALSNTQDSSLNDIEKTIGQAIKFSPADTYYSALSRLYFAKAQVATQAGATPENQEVFKTAVSASVMSASEAVAINPSSYENWLVLGSIQSALVPPPISYPNAYENAKLALTQAASRNPSSPEPFFLLGQLEANKGDLLKARDYIRQALIIKEDYVEARLLLEKIEKFLILER